MFGVISLLFLLAGSLSPGWLVLNVSRFTDLSDPDTADDATVHLGLFYLLLVGENISISLGYDSIPDEGASYAEELGVFGCCPVCWRVISYLKKVTHVYYWSDWGEGGKKWGGGGRGIPFLGCQLY